VDVLQLKQEYFGRLDMNEIRTIGLSVKKPHDRNLVVPADLLTWLDLQDGEEIKATVVGDSIHITRLDAFLSLRGALADDDAFDQAMAILEQGWQTWPTPESV
jgi:antitoxin component of MazEF toxin-antitoxin module